MKKIITLAIAIVLATGAASAAPAHAKKLKAKTNGIERIAQNRKNIIGKHAAAIASRAANRQPGHEDAYYWDATAADWVLYAAIDYKYAGAAAPASYTIYGEDGTAESRTDITYDGLEQPLEVLEYANGATSGDPVWNPSSRNTRAYDAIVKDFITSNIYYAPSATTWVKSYGNEYPITRNANGIVTAVDRTSYYSGTFEPITKLACSLDADGKTVTGFNIDELYDDGYGEEWENYMDLRQIEWENTDGQILGFDYTDYAVGANRIKSAVLFWDGNPDALFAGEYKNDFEGKLTIMYFDDYKILFERQYTDAATGSYKEISSMSYVEDNVTYSEEDVYTVTYDDKGNAISEVDQYYVDGELYSTDATVCQYTYNAEGELIETVYSYYDEDADDYVYDTRIVSSDFVDVNGIAAVDADGAVTMRFMGRSVIVSSPAAATCTVYALDGRSIASAAGSESFDLSLDSAPAGIYIVALTTANTTKTCKVAIK